jgi:predicted aspartyl protease
MKTPYSAGYSPPAPVLSVSIAEPDGQVRLGPFEALVDTGADGTFVPTSLVARLGVPIVYTTGVRSHLSQAVSHVAVHRVDLVIGSLRLPAVEIVSDDWGTEIIIGRNVLNKLRLHLDGPSHIVDLAE